jgi:signal transduction histidine kinase
MNLRRFSVFFVVVTGLLGLVLAGALVVTTTRLHAAAQRIGVSVESVAITEDIGLELASLRDASDVPSRAAHADRVQRLATEAEQYVDGVAEAAVFGRLAVAIDRCLAVSPTAASENRGQLFEAAINAARELRHINIDQSRRFVDVAARWDRVANTLGIAAILVFAVGLGAVAWWLQRRAFKPAIQLVGSIERYTQGDRSARATEEGPAEFRSIAQRFNDMASKLESQRNAQLAFLAGVAHDLRNPLSALKMAAGMIEADQPLPSEDRVRLLFSRVQRQIDRMERMVFDFLDAARIEAGNLELHMERCDARDLTRAIVDLFEPANRTHQLVAESPEEPVALVCDPGRIEQVLTNLVSNAIKYSPRGGSVRVAVARKAETVELSVTDEGVGMSAEDVDQVFEPFRRTGTSKEMIPGVGLGLFVARRIVESHGGRISVTTAVGTGATFTVQLPSGDPV